MKISKFDKRFKMLMLSLMAVILLSFQFGTALAATANNYTDTLNQGETLEGTGFFSGDTVRVNGNVNGPTFVSGGNIEVNGNIDGDLFVAGQSIRVAGNVTGSIFVAGQDINISGKINNSIYSAGANLNIESQNDGSAFLAGQNIFLKNPAKVGRDAFIAGAKVTADGTVGGDLGASAEDVTVLGTVGKNVDLEAPKVKIEGATIDGNLKYKSENEATISQDSTIGGTTDWKKAESKKVASAFTLTVLYSTLISIIGALIVWFVVKLLRPLLWTTLAHTFLSSPLKTMGVGFIAIFLIPIISIILMITIVGVPLGLILMPLYIIVLYISKIIIAVALAESFKQQFNWKDKHMGVWLVLLSFIILAVIGFIPYIGPIFQILMAIAGFGTVILNLRKARQ